MTPIQMLDVLLKAEGAHVLASSEPTEVAYAIRSRIADVRDALYAAVRERVKKPSDRKRRRK